MKQEDDYSIGELMVHLYQELLGEVVPSLRGVAVEWKHNFIVIYFYHDGPLNDQIYDHYGSIATEVIAHYANAVLDERVISLSYPAQLKNHQHWVYKRKEPFEDPSDETYLNNG